VDTSATDWEHQMEAVHEVLHEADAAGHRTLIAFHKVDRLTHAEEEALRTRASALMGPHVFTSVLEKGGIVPLQTALKSELRARMATVRVSFPAEAGRILAEAYQEGEVLQREMLDGRIVLTARIPDALLGRWRGSAEVEVEREDTAPGNGTP